MEKNNKNTCSNNTTNDSICEKGFTNNHEKIYYLPEYGFALNQYNQIIGYGQTINGGIQIHHRENFKTITNLETGKAEKILSVQYYFQNWIITIENYFDTGKYIGFAVPIKYAKDITIENYNFIGQIPSFKTIPDDFQYIMANPEDVETYFLANINVQSSSDVLDYMKKLIQNESR